MYWNKNSLLIPCKSYSSWIVTLDVLKFDSLYISIFAVELNSNIRCIEIPKNDVYGANNLRWIVTLDVLKCSYLSSIMLYLALNSNIRCIEIIPVNRILNQLACWIVTLDVLKCTWCYTRYCGRNCWIVTLDVLKYIEHFENNR